MTQIKVDNVVDAAGTAAADFTSGLTVAGAALSTLNTAEYYETGTEPTSPKNGAIWKDTANDKVMVYIADEFKEIELGAAADASWTVDLSNVTYDNISLSVTSQESNPYDLGFSPDGIKMYVTGYSSDRLHQYSLSTAFDLSTVSYDSVSLSALPEGPNPRGMAFNNDGTKLYHVGNTNDVVLQYSLSTAYDLSTASYDSVSFSIVSQAGTPSDLEFNTDGTKMYMLVRSTNAVYQYNLSTGFDLSTASYNSVSFSFAAVDTASVGIHFNPDGTKMYMLGATNDKVFLYTLSTGFDISTASYDNVSFSVASQEQAPSGLTFSPDGAKMYIIGLTGDTIYQYSTGL